MPSHGASHPRLLRFHPPELHVHPSSVLLTLTVFRMFSLASRCLLNCHVMCVLCGVRLTHVFISVALSRTDGNGNGQHQPDVSSRNAHIHERNAAYDSYSAFWNYSKGSSWYVSIHQSYEECLVSLPRLPLFLLPLTRFSHTQARNGECA